MDNRRGGTTLRVFEISLTRPDPLAFWCVLQKGGYSEWRSTGID